VKMVFSVFVKDDLLVHQTKMILGPMNDTCRLIEIRNSCDICQSVRLSHTFLRYSVLERFSKCILNVEVTADISK